MTREDIINMIAKVYGVVWTNEAQLKDLEQFAALVASAERERILDICKEGLWDAEGIRYHLDNRARGQA